MFNEGQTLRFHTYIYGSLCMSQKCIWYQLMKASEYILRNFSTRWHVQYIGPWNQLTFLTRVLFHHRILCKNKTDTNPLPTFSHAHSKESTTLSTIIYTYFSLWSPAQIKIITVFFVDLWCNFSSLILGWLNYLSFGSRGFSIADLSGIHLVPKASSSSSTARVYSSLLCSGSPSTESRRNDLSRWLPSTESR